MGCLMLSGHAGGRYDGLMKAAWQQAAVTSVPPPAAVGLTLNADRLTLLASTPKAKAASVIPYLSQVAATACPPHPTAVHTMKACLLPVLALHVMCKCAGFQTEPYAGVTSGCAFACCSRPCNRLNGNFQTWSFGQATRPELHRFCCQPCNISQASIPADTTTCSYCWTVSSCMQ